MLNRIIINPIFIAFKRSPYSYINHLNLMKSFTIEEINEIIKGELAWKISQNINGPEQLEKAGNTKVIFVDGELPLRLCDSTKVCSKI